MPLQVTLSWHKAERAEGYKVYITIPSDARREIDVVKQPATGELAPAEIEKKRANTAINTTDTFAVLTLPRYCQTYTWWVVAYNDAGQSAPSAEWSFTAVAPEVLPAPVLASPANGATDLPLANTFVWTPSERAESYTLYIGTRPNYDPVGIVQKIETADTSAFANVPYCNTTYYWWVVALNCGGESMPSEIFSFTAISPLSPEPPLLASPPDGDTIKGIITYPFFSWYPSQGAASYEVFISTTPDEAGITQTFVTNDTVSGSPILVENTTYYWWVKACNFCGFCSEKSNIWSFTYVGFEDVKARSVQELSDAFLKTNVTPLTESLTKVEQLNGIYFNWDTSQYSEIGFEQGR